MKLNPFDPPFVVPTELAKRKNWIGWRAALHPGEAKPRKIPVCIRTGSGKGYLDPKNHVSYDEAVEAIERLRLSGVGFVLTPGCGLVGGDMDKCRNPATGEIEGWARAVIDWGETYFEVSPSGEGVRFWALADATLLRAIKSSAAGVELYPSGRYLTFTGDKLESASYDIQRAPKAIHALMHRARSYKGEDANPDRAFKDAADDPTSPEAFKRYIYRQSLWGRINQEALKRILEWAPELFPQGSPTAAGGWRVKSADLGRPDLIEDLSIDPRGTSDWGVHDMQDIHPTRGDREGGRTAIDVVLEWGATVGVGNAKEAAQWLAERLNIPFVDSPPDNKPPPEGALPKLGGVRFLRGEVLPPREFLVAGGWIPMRKVTLLQGDGGDGKTLLMQQLQSSCATGCLWIGLEVMECASCGFYTEDEDYDAKERQQAVDAHYGRFCPEGDRMFVFPRTGEENELVVFDRARRPVLTPFYWQMVEAVKDTHARLAVLDVAVDLYGGNENVRPEVRALFRPLNALARDIDGAVVMTTHVSQAGIRSDGGHSGSTDWSNAARSRLYLNRPDDQTDPYMRVLTRKKANYATIGDRLELRWRNGVIVRDGDPEKDRPMATDAFLMLFDAMTRENQTLSAKSRASNYAPRMFMRRMAQERHGYQQGDFEQAMQRLFQTGQVQMETYREDSKTKEKLVRIQPL